MNEERANRPQLQVRQAAGRFPARVDVMHGCPNISNNIDRALHRSWFDPKTITVTATGGKVKLTGSVETPSDRFVAGATAWGAPGATQVENDLVIA